MIGIVRLYPRPWRERYGDELLALLDEHPATLLDRLDLIQGAIDARLHPQVPGTDVTPDKEIPMHVRLLGTLAGIGGVAWLIAIISIFVLPPNVDGDADTSIAMFGLAIGIALTGIALGELGSRSGSTPSAVTGHAISFISLAFGGLIIAPWPWFIIALLGFPILGFVAALRGSTNGTMPNWLAGVFGLAGVGTLAGSLGSIENDIGLALLGSIGLAALVLAWLALSGEAHGSSEARPA